MSAPTKQGASRWGSFLQQAVAGIEQNLDNILSGEDVPQTHNKTTAPVAAPKEAVPTPPRSSTPSGSSRLQERLAKAVTAKAAAQKNGTQTPSTSNPPSRAGTPSILGASPRPSIDSVATAEVEEETPTATPEPLAKGKENEALPTVQVEDTSKDDALAHKSSTEEASVASPTTNGLLKDKIDHASPRPSTESITSAAPRQSLGSRQSLQAIDSSARPSEDSNARVQQILSDADREEEIHAYIERIDALQAKLQYLAKESADSARKAAAEAGAGTSLKKLAEKDEQIALLMEEGQKLSKTELKHMTVIKMLRSTTSEKEKEAKLAKDRLEKSEKEKASLAQRLKKAEAEGKQGAQNQKRLTQLEKDLDTVRSENKSKDETIASLRKQLSEAASQATADEVKKLQKDVQEKQSRINDLEEEVSSEKIERSLLTDKSAALQKELEAKLEREAERARVAEVELKGEIQALEGRLEIMRSRAEEVSSGATGDAQAKLMRQIETLQSQYSVASENWQGIESSLEARVTTLQRERDEALKKEAETRKKAREMTQKAKANEDETESLHNKITELTSELSQLRTQLATVQKTASEHESALKQAKEQFEKEKTELQQRLEESQTIQRQNSLPPQSPYGNFDRAVSEVASSRRGLTAEFLGLQNIQTSRRPSRGVIDDLPYPDRRISRTGSRANIHGMQGGLQSAGFVTPKRQDSNLLLSPIDGVAGDRGFGERGVIGGGQSTADPEDYFENVASPADQQNNMDGLGSVSTTAAGPSVQLVDRLSAAVRRLENEKVGMREELSRLASQRDEARSSIVDLMKEVEEKRGDRERVGELGKEVEELNKRYEATLEMLGEKSEMVEELKADVGDLKGMYRNLAEEYAKLKT